MTRAVVARALAAGAILLAVLSPGEAGAADPSPSLSTRPSEEPAFGSAFDAWQDEALPPDVPAGRTVPVGFTVWDHVAGQLVRVNSAELRVHPKTGKAAPTVFPTQTDWLGHLRAEITIPRGGLGAIEVGFRGQECVDETGTCREVFLPFNSAGVGPPPEAPRSVLVDGQIVPPSEPVSAGLPFDVEVELEPRAAWDPAALALPDRVVLVARRIRGADLASAELRASAGPPGPFVGSITIPESGDVVLLAGFPGTGTEPDLIDRSIFRIRVDPAEGGDPTAAPAAPGPAGGRSSLPVVPIAAGAAALLALAIVVRRVFADL